MVTSVLFKDAKIEKMSLSRYFSWIYKKVIKILKKIL